jgi:DNA invertase Pin-like site-specific DNA recombinase
VSQKRPQSQPEPAPEQISVARLEQLRANFEAARKAGRWHKPILTDEQRQTAAELLAELALIDKEPISEGA